MNWLEVSLTVNGELVQSIEDTGVMAVPLEAINKIKGELQ